jgi:RHS repeat-associated protein
MPRKARVEFPGAVYHLLDETAENLRLTPIWPPSVNGSTLGYDDRFNLHQFGGAIYEHDSANQLTSVSGNGHSASFTYDGVGRCVRRTVDGVTRLFTYDAWNPIIEFDQAGNWKAMNLYGFGADEILGRYDAVLGALIYKQDKQGNVAFVLNPSNQTVEKYSYDAYGQPTIMDGAGNGRSQSAIGNRFMYTGREWIGELGLYDYRHRFYFPGIGRFLETDPMGLQTEGEKLSAGQKALFSPGGSAPEAFSSSEMNLFRYCGDDPVDGSDPMGLWWEVEEFNKADNLKIWQMIQTAEKLPGPEGDRFRAIGKSLDYRVVIIPIQTNPADIKRWQIGARAPGDEKINQTTANDPVNNSNGRGVGSRVEFDPNNKKDPDGHLRDPIDAFGHEAGGHAYRNITGTNSNDKAKEEPLARDFQIQFHKALKKMKEKGE